MAGIAQLVERQVVVLDVTGSSPVARPIPGRAAVSVDDVVGLVLAGGKSRRLGGGDKPLLPLRDASILDRLLSVMRGEVSHCAISSNGNPSRFANFGLPVLADER